MAIYYKVDVRSDYNDLTNKNTKIIIQKGFIYAKEIKTKERIMICDNKFQGSLYGYYVMSTDFKVENIATLEEVKTYLEEFSFNKMPIYTKMEEKETKKLIRKYHKSNGE
ncbi:MAG: hypothetical protein K6E99_00675 [Bacilli bacterium]|nr:hypothetical protein [Bacilli bacterium]